MLSLRFRTPTSRLQDQKAPQRILIPSNETCTNSTRIRRPCPDDHKVLEIRVGGYGAVGPDIFSARGFQGGPFTWRSATHRHSISAPP